MLKSQFFTWCEENNLSLENFDEKTQRFEIKGFGKCLLLNSKEVVVESSLSNPEAYTAQHIFDEELTLVLDQSDYDNADGLDYLVYQFGVKFYYSDRIEKVTLQELKYVGESNLVMEKIDFPFLGIHSGYDLCNGSGHYSDYIKKARFLGITALGVCEENTLGGVLSFIESCHKNKIRPIVGETIKVLGTDGNFYNIKCYLKSNSSWRNLLLINKLVNVEGRGSHIPENLLLEHLKDLIVVLSPEVQLDLVYTSYFNVCGKDLYYTLDLSEWDSQTKDSLVLTNIQNYLTNYLDKLTPLLITDAYFLEQNQSHIRGILNKTGHIGFKSTSKNHFFKSVDDYSLEFFELFKDDNKAYNLLTDCINNTIRVFDGIEIDLLQKRFFLPQYQRSEKEERFSNNRELFLHYIEEGFVEKIEKRGKDVELYRKRIQDELEVIELGKFVDYFLILVDFYRYAKENDIWMGLGRGSAGGSLVAYLVGITGIDPIEYNLLFERFLNRGRIEKSMPDIDCDIQSDRRQDIKNYLEFKYGRDYITSITTYGSFKIKNALKDLARAKGIGSDKMNLVTAIIEDSSLDISDFLRLSKQKSVIYELIQELPDLIEDLSLCLNQPKNASTHAAGFIIVPKEFGTVYEQLPVKEVEGTIITQWEGYYVDQAGYCKIDLLGLKQLDKFSATSKLIQQQLGEKVTYDSIGLKDQRVYELFRQGYNEDVFQFGAPGLRAYCKELEPSTIDDLIAIVALYRPGTIESGVHKSYIRRKKGEEDSTPDPGTDEITKNTYGLMVYQEQTMQICQAVGGFTLVEADDVRKALGKMKKEYAEPYKEQFIKVATTEKGFDRVKIEKLWDKIVAFALYSFNKSHATAYAITAYYSQWFKVHYPLQFWTVSLQTSEDSQRSQRIQEIKKTSNIEVSSVDINHSHYNFTCDVKTNAIYWSLPSVKFVGEVVVESILEERKNGEFFSLEEFVSRMRGKGGMNIRAVSNLIISGAFDKVEGVSDIKHRFQLLKKYYDSESRKLKEDFVDMENWSETDWVLKQKELTGFGLFNFNKIIHQSHLSSYLSRYKDCFEVLEEVPPTIANPPLILVTGLLVNIIERNSKRGKFGQLEISDNTSTIFITCWNETYEQYRDLLKISKNKIILLTGTIGYDTYKNQNVIYSTKTSKIELA